MKPRIYIPFSPQARAAFLAPTAQAHLGRIAEPVYPDDAEAPWDDVPEDVEAVLTGWGGPTKLPQSVWRSLPNLKAIAVLGGSPMVVEDAAGAIDEGIVVISASHAIAEGVAEETIGLMLASQYELVDSACAYRRTGKLVVDGNHRNRSLAGSVIGLIGFGYVGQQVAARLRAFGPELWAFDPYAADETLQRLEVRRVGLGELAAGSDIISVHAGWTPETQGMIDRALLEQVRPGTLIVSTARMPLFDEAALAELVRSGRVRFASDFVPFDASIWSSPELHERSNLIAVPGHTSITTRTIEQMGLLLAQDLERVFHGQRPQHAVSRQWMAHTTVLAPAKH